MYFFANHLKTCYRSLTSLPVTVCLILIITTLTACQSGDGDPVVVMTPASTDASAAPESTEGQMEASPTDTPAAEAQAGSDATSSEVTDNNVTDNEGAVTDPETADGDVAGAELATADTSTAGETNAPTFDPETVTIQLEPVIQGLDRPIFVTHAGDGSGRLFVVEKTGVIRIWTDGQVAATPFLDIQDKVRSSGNEQGLLGLAFAPNYASSGYFFVNYSDLNGDTMIARYQVSADDSNQADAASEFVILQLDQPAQNHNGGMLLFGPDGALYIGTGDGGAAGDRFGNGQNPQTLLGKMLRLDVTTDPSVPYSIPADNPWITATWNGNEVNDEIWAIGLRNPWRYSFDRATGDLWIADVGQNAYEEINLTRAEEFPAADSGGLNYGWPIMEGQHCYSPSSNCDTTGLVLPLAEYGHQGHCSVTGGYVYRGEQYPVLNGVYLYGDYCSGYMWALAPDGADGWTNTEIMQTGATLSSFGEDEAGEIYLADYGTGTIYQITAQP